MMRRWCGGVALLLSMLAARGVSAQTCAVSSSGLTFGTYDPFASTPASITGTVSVTCQAVVALGLSYSIQIGTGGGGGSFNTRMLASGSGRLSYQLYTTSTRSTVWGDGTGGTGVVSDGYLLAALGSVSKSYTIYGSIIAGQMVPAGVYSDISSVLIVY